MENKVDTFIKNPKKALFKLASPIIIAMTFQTLYNIVDTAFVGRLGAESIAALTFSFPLFLILIALNQGINVGMSQRISRYLGAKQKHAAENTAIHGLLMSLLFAIIILILGAPFLNYLFTLIGAEGIVLSLATDYMSIILIGSLFMFPAFVINRIFAAQGDTKTPMKVQIASLLLNIILDPIFIYGFGWGVKGAAMATAVSFLLALVMYLYYLHFKSYLQVRLSSFRFNSKLIKEIIAVGMPATLTMLLVSLYILFINKFMASFGVDYVASFGLAARLQNIAIMPIFAFGMALTTLTGMFYGAKRYDLLKPTINYAIKISVLITSIIGLVLFILSKPLLLIFTPDQNLLGLATAYLRIDVFTLPTIAIALLVSRAMHGMGFGFPGLIINLIRLIFIAIPLAYLFIFILGFGYLSAAVATIIGGIIADIVAVIWISAKLKKFSNKAKV